jgi:hypothetical protein
VSVGSELAFRTEFANAAQTQIDLTANISLTCNGTNDAAIRTNGVPLVIDGHGFTISQTCATPSKDSGVLENVAQMGTAGLLTLRNVTITGGAKIGLSASSGGNVDGGGAYSDAGLTLDHAVVTGNSVDRGNQVGGNGGGVSGGPLTILDSTVSNNTAQNNGGGADTSAGEALVITGSTISGNTATNQGGGGFAAAAQSTAEVTDSLITQNHALALSGGGGVLGLGPNLITRSTFSGNDAASHGGGLNGGDDTTITDSTISGNTASSYGGGVNNGNIGASLTITRSTISGNDSGTAGGGIDTGGSDTTVWLTDSTLSGNTAVDGGGIDIGGGGSALHLTNSTVSGNTATDNGGGIDFGGGDTLAMTYATVRGNTAPDGANILIGAGDVTASAFGTVVADPLGGGDNCDNSSPITSNGFNYEAVTDTCNFGDATDVASGPTPQLGALADNGGPTLTHLPAATSPLIDKIPVSACPGIPDQGITTDQRGIARPQQSGCDIGSVEVAAPVPVELVIRFTG